MISKAEFKRVLADRLKLARETLGWDQKTLAKQSGINTSTLCRIEAARVMPTAYVSVALAAAVGVDIGTLLPGGDMPRRNNKQKGKQ